MQNAIIEQLGDDDISILCLTLTCKNLLALRPQVPINTIEISLGKHGNLTLLEWWRKWSQPLGCIAHIFGGATVANNTQILELFKVGYVPETDSTTDKIILITSWKYVVVSHEWFWYMVASAPVATYEKFEPFTILCDVDKIVPWYVESLIRVGNIKCLDFYLRVMINVMDPDEATTYAYKPEKIGETTYVPLEQFSTPVKRFAYFTPEDPDWIEILFDIALDSKRANTIKYMLYDSPIKIEIHEMLESSNTHRDSIIARRFGEPGSIEIFELLKPWAPDNTIVMKRIIQHWDINLLLYLVKHISLIQPKTVLKAVQNTTIHFANHNFTDIMYKCLETLLKLNPNAILPVITDIIQTLLISDKSCFTAFNLLWSIPRSELSRFDIPALLSNVKYYYIRSLVSHLVCMTNYKLQEQNVRNCLETLKQYCDAMVNYRVVDKGELELYLAVDITSKTLVNIIENPHNPEFTFGINVITTNGENRQPVGIRFKTLSLSPQDKVIIMRDILQWCSTTLEPTTKNNLNAYLNYINWVRHICDLIIAEQPNVNVSNQQ
jgi:hypothetical protein